MPKLNITKFHSFEEQVSYFVNKTGICLPRMTYGKTKFFRDLGRWQKNYNPCEINLSYILPDPAQGLSFPNANDVLSSALCLGNKQKHSNADVYNLLENFGLPKEKATQPVVSLSGGELLLLNFAKAKAMMSSVNGIVACSPTNWLNENRYTYWNKLQNDYLSEIKDVDVLLLDGEPFPENSINNYNNFDPITPINWFMQISDLEILFDEVQFPTYHPMSKINFSSNNKDFKLISPTLLTGDNGIGKSIFSKILSGIKKYNKGTLNIKTPNGTGYARLLFQDAIDQLFSMSIENHFDWVFRFDSFKREEALPIYNEMDKVLREYVKDNNLRAISAIGNQTQRNTLLQAKMSLITERLSACPSLLILDEPAWGLSRSIARNFVWAVCKQAHKYNVAVLIISHKNDWLKGIISSHLHLTKEKNATIKIEEKETLTYV